MAENHKPLSIPPEAEGDANSIEMIRGWIAGGGLRCSLNVGHWHGTTEIDERDAWGVMLADIARQLADALAESNGLDRSESMSRVVQSFVGELGREASFEVSRTVPKQDSESDRGSENTQRE